MSHAVKNLAGLPDCRKKHRNTYYSCYLGSTQYDFITK